MTENDLTPEQPPAEPVVAAAKPRKKASIFADPVVRVLAFIAAGIVGLYLLTVVSALIMGVLRPSAPRTNVERTVRVYENAVANNPKDIGAWKLYIAGLIADGQPAAAQDAISRALKVVDEKGPRDITSLQAELFFATDEFDKGIKLVDKTRAEMKKYHEEQKKKNGTPESFGSEITENYWSLLLMKGEALVQQKKLDEAIKVYNEYMKGKPAAADILVRRGQLKAENGDIKGAEADFRQALKFLPGDEAALAELKKIGAEE